MFAPAPFLLKDTSVSQVMTQVCIALVPGIAAYAWLVGPAILIQLVIAALAALAAAVMVWTGLALAWRRLVQPALRRRRAAAGQ